MANTTRVAITAAQMAAGRVKTDSAVARSPSLNAFAERPVRSVKPKCLSKPYSAKVAAACLLHAERVITRARATCCRFPSMRNRKAGAASRSRVENDWPACSSITTVPHD